MVSLCLVLTAPLHIVDMSDRIPAGSIPSPYVYMYTECMSACTAAGLNSHPHNPNPDLPFPQATNLIQQLSPNTDASWKSVAGQIFSFLLAWSPFNPAYWSPLSSSTKSETSTSSSLHHIKRNKVVRTVALQSCHNAQLSLKRSDRHSNLLIPHHAAKQPHSSAPGDNRRRHGR